VDGSLRDAVALLAGVGQVVEVRALADQNTHSGYFNDYDALVRQVEARGSDPTIQGIYITLNKVNPALLSRRANRIKERLGRKDSSTADIDIVRRRWLPIDIDPLRPSGVSSTDEEHTLALAKAEEVSCWIAGLGFPEPVRADSGNGAHILYRIDLPNDNAATELVKACLATLDTLFSDDKVNVDTTNFNAGRIWKLYGTVSRKGDSTPERPHRRSCIISAPDVPGVATREQLEVIVARLPTEAHATQPPRTKGKNIDLRQWLSDHGLDVQFDKPYSGGTLYTLDQCPFSSAHKDGAFAIQFGSGAIFAGCQHLSCGGGNQRWPELREQHEPGKKRSITKPDNPPAKILPAPAPGAEDKHANDALLVLRSGDPVRTMLRTFALDHEGDETVAECLIMSLASRYVLNTTGLHVSVSGESGKGKSHAFSTLIRQVPERHQLAGSMSNKALFYIDNPQPGMVIVLDDTSLSEDMSEILKGVTTSFKKPFVYRTVNKDRKGCVCTIRERCVWWVAKVEGSGDDQVFNRMLTCWIDDTLEQDDRVLTRILDDSEALPEHGELERPDVMMCRAMWEALGRERLHVVIPFAKRIRFQSQINRRNPEMLLGLVKAQSLLFSLQRERMDTNGVPCITATRADFDSAARLYSLLNSSAGGQTTKLTKMESDLVGTISTLHRIEFTIPMLQNATGLSNSVLHRLIHGYNSRGAAYTGLLEKCPAIAYTDRSVISEDEQTGYSTRRRTNAYTFDHELFKKWMSGGAVWLENAPGPDNDDLTESRQSSCSITEGSVRSKTAESRGESDVLCTNTSFIVPNSESHGETDLTNGDVSAGTAASSYACDTGNSVRPEQKTEPGVQNVEPDGNQPPITSRKPAEHSVGMGISAAGLENQPAAGNPTERRLIKATDYKKLEIPERRVVCYCCSRKGAWYVEKLTAERKARPKDQRDARRICKVCYKAAVKAEQEASVPLPGIVDVSLCTRVTADVGKCSVCGIVRAEWIDREAGVKLCEHCYERETLTLRQVVTSS